MKSLAQQMAFYGLYHRDPLNKASHLIGVPLITFSVLVAFSWVRFPVAGCEIPFAVPFTLVVAAYYFMLDFMFAFSLSVILVPALFYADQIARLPWGSSVSVFAACFGIGWVFQLIGHAIEGKKPALVDNFFQVFVAPIFLMAEVFFMLGLRQDLKRQVEELMVMD